MGLVQDAAEDSPNVHAGAIHQRQVPECSAGRRIDRGSHAHVPVQGDASRGIDCGERVVKLSTDLAEHARRVERRPGELEVAHLLIRLGIPRSRQAEEEIQLGHTDAGIPANGGEASGSEHRCAVHDEIGDDGVGIWIPRRRQAGRGAESGHAISGRTADVRKRPPGVERGAGERERQARDSTIRVRIPARCQTRRAVDCGDAVARLSADVREAPSHVREGRREQDF